jgi:hypothetical protein
MESEIWEQAQVIIKGQLNLSMSKYLEIMLRQLFASQTQTQRQMYEDLAGLLFREMQQKPRQNVRKKVDKKVDKRRKVEK